MSISIPTAKSQDDIPAQVRSDRTKMGFWLLAMGFVPLPVAPRQDAHKYPLLDKKTGEIVLDENGDPKPLFNGKNPSYLDKNGIPHLIAYSQFRNRMPTREELEKWFANPLNGIGTLALNNVALIDIDSKNFESQEACEKAFYSRLDQYPKLYQSFLAQTHSKGFRIGIICEEPPDFTKFSLSESGDLAGEVIHGGQFSVLPGSLGVSGNPYRLIAPLPDALVEIKSLQSIGIYPFSKSKATKTQSMPSSTATTNKPSSNTNASIDLLKVCSKSVLSLLENPSGDEADRSGILTKVARELFGWEIWLNQWGLSSTSSAENIVNSCGRNLNVPASRIESILTSIKGLDNCIPAVKYASGGNDEKCWLQLRAVSKMQYEKRCPEDIRIRLEAQFASKKSKKNEDDTKKAPDNVVAFEIAEKYRGILAYNDSRQTWFRYSAEELGKWSAETNASIERIIQSELDCREDFAKDGYSIHCLKSIAGLVTRYLLERNWEETPGLIPLQDGVLDLATGELLEHQPGYRFLWLLPYRWADRVKGYDIVKTWLNEATKNNEQLVEVLRAYLKAIITGRTDLQRYLELIGAGGTGKSTYINLATALIGEDNTFATELRQLENNRFESAAIYGKKLVIIADSQRYGGEVAVLKSLTGGDALRFEQKNVQQSKPFIPNALVLVAANEPIQSSDYTSGLERRRLTIPFTNVVPPEKRRDLQEEFKPFLAGVLDWVLSMPDEEVTNLIRNSNKLVDILKEWKTETLLNCNPMADWLDSCLIFETGAKTYIGNATRDKTGGEHIYLNTQFWLYASYCEHLESQGNKAVSGKRFSNLLEDLLVNQLGRQELKKSHDRLGNFFPGIAIRSSRHIDIPRPLSESLSSTIPYNPEFADEPAPNFTSEVPKEEPPEQKELDFDEKSPEEKVIFQWKNALLKAETTEAIAEIWSSLHETKDEQLIMSVKSKLATVRVQEFEQLPLAKFKLYDMVFRGENVAQVESRNYSGNQWNYIVKNESDELEQVSELVLELYT